jgi:uncharacterized protein with HEPN domain
MNAADRVRLRHMVDGARQATEFAQGRTRADLDSDQMLLRALTQCLTIVGEAASKVSPKGRDAVPSLLWRDIIGMRNWLVHAYFDIDVDTVWDTVTDDLPPLISTLEAWFARKPDETG